MLEPSVIHTARCGTGAQSSSPPMPYVLIQQMVTECLPGTVLGAVGTNSLEQDTVCTLQKPAVVVRQAVE